MMQNKPMVLVSGVAAIITLVVSGLSAYLVPHIPLIWQISLGVSVVAGVAYLYLDKEAFKTSMAKRTTQYGINSVVMSVLFIGVIVFINVIANEYDLKKDVTKNKLNTLSEESIKVLKGLDTEITARAFLQPNQVPVFEKIFSRYSYYSDKLKKEYVDLDKDPLAVRRHNIKSAGTIVFESAARSARVENLRGADDPKLEEKLTNAIIQVAKGDKKKIYFLKGHGERSIEDKGRDGYSNIKETLSAGRYNVEELILLDKDTVPSDADLLVVAGPKSAFTKHELDVMKAYIEGAGKALIMLDPTSTPSIQPIVKMLGAEWTPKETVFETNKLQQLAGGNPLAPIITSYDSRHEITKENRELSIYPVATPIKKAEKAPGKLEVQSLFKTSDRSMIAKLQGNKLNVDKNKAPKGPVSLAVAVKGTFKNVEAPKKPEGKVDPQAVLDKAKADIEKAKGEKETRVVLVGDSDFAANGVGQFGINADMFQNMLSWLAKEEDLIAIRPKDTSVSEFEITDARLRVIHVASVFILPFLAMLSGLGMWISRRRR